MFPSPFSASEWDVEERQALVTGAIALEAKSKNRKRSYNVAFKSLPFDQLDIPDKSAEDCQQMLEKLISKVCGLKGVLWHEGSIYLEYSKYLSP